MPHVPTYQIDQIRELESIASQRYGISNAMMMQRAGKAAIQVLTKRWPTAKHIAVFCGPGNNGGDGYVLAHLAHQNRLKVQIWQVGNAQNLKAEALKAYEDCKKAGITISEFHGQSPFPVSDVIVDAIHGIGLQGEVKQATKLAIDAINRASVPVLALDIPSGIDANTGRVWGAAIHADVTVTFIGAKVGLLTGSGAINAGQVVCDTLQLPAEMYALVKPSVEPLYLEQFSAFFKPRPRDWHKGKAGHVLVIGGTKGFSGAPRMAAEAALRVGAGLVSVATHPDHAAVFNLTRPEMMCHGVRTPIALKPLLKAASVVVIGPGLGQSLWGKNLLAAVLRSKLPLIVDADALNIIATKPRVRSNWVLTPHPGEAGRLLHMTPEQVQNDRLAALRKLQKNFGGTVVLKGAGSLVLTPQNGPAICLRGNPGMATAGMGDVLSGVIGGLIAQGLSLPVAAKLGVLLHATAGDIVAKENGERGMLAMDLMPALHKLVNVQASLES